MSRARTLIPFTLGADPEFVVYSKEKKLVYARSTRHHSADEDLGGDSSGRPFEVRPDPSEDPYEVVSNIRAILSTHVRRHPTFFDYTWRAGSFHSQSGDSITPIGGHIHVGNKDLDPANTSVLLDAYLGVASSLLENYEEGLKRRAGDNHIHGYGLATDFRVQEAYGFEYRTCASWLASPHIAAAFLCLTKVVIHQLLNTKKAAFYDDGKIQAAINKLDTKALRAMWPDIWKSIISMELYPKYKSHLDLMNLLITAKRTWYPTRAMQSAWGIPPPAFHAKHTVTLSALWDSLGGKVDKTRKVLSDNNFLTATNLAKAPKRESVLDDPQYVDALAGVEDDIG